jgi:NAD-dependent DNA ligase
MENYEKLEFRNNPRMKKAEIDKALHTLEGMIKGIGIDKKLNEEEVSEILNWIDKTRKSIKTKIFNDIYKHLDRILEDLIITTEEKEDFLWLCKSFISGNEFFNVVTSDLQRLQGLMHGILADNTITTEEIHGLRSWIYNNEHLQGQYPYDEIQSLINQFLKDGILDEEEKEILKLYFADFIDPTKSKHINFDEVQELKKKYTISGICSLDPIIEFENKIFTFTGISEKAKRTEIAKIIDSKGGIYLDKVRKDINYLIIGADGNPCWAYSCYGRKVEAVVNLRKQGSSALIVNELDFWDAL